jgi:DNA helicase II / ATP-dependent DNA helicase PcrA
MTRAKDHLDLVVPQRFFVRQQRDDGNHHMYAARTRFIEDSILNLFKRIAWPGATASGDNTASPQREPINIGERLRQRWSS